MVREGICDAVQYKSFKNFQEDFCFDRYLIKRDGTSEITAASIHRPVIRKNQRLFIEMNQKEPTCYLDHRYT